ncbi:endo alpha-1,4 polygalactosaminidase [Micromonospora chersina]|uniref:endo alpha-1,4 polygalactosaminidase n=1 Tax=Micromonospora chersina TaxID=47854 RepID=UPI0037B9E0D9
MSLGGRWRAAAALAVGLALAVTGCTRGAPARPAGTRTGPAPVSGGWVYQLQGYPGGRLDALARTPQPLAVIDLARDAHADYFTPAEIGALRSSGKVVLAYFEIGSIEQFRPEYPRIRQEPGLVLNRWPDWPDEFFVRYWEQRWWDLAVRPRIDQAVRAGFDGIYLDTPLAYEELDLALTPGRSRTDLARAMVELIVRISRYAKAQRPGLLVYPQNSPELRAYDGYTAAIDGIGMEDLFYRSPGDPCTESWCEENLGNARALRDAGKQVLAVDYADRAEDVRAACARYRQEGFGGYVTSRALDRVRPPCP